MSSCRLHLCWVRRAHTLLMQRPAAAPAASCLPRSHDTRCALSCLRGRTPCVASHHSTWAALRTTRCYYQHHHHHTNEAHAMAESARATSEAAAAASPVMAAARQTRPAVRTMERPGTTTSTTTLLHTKEDEKEEDASGLAHIGQPVRSAAVYAATLHKCLTPRHRRPHHRRSSRAERHEPREDTRHGDAMSDEAAEEGTPSADVHSAGRREGSSTTSSHTGNVLGNGGGYDPALVIRLDSRRKLLKLNATQAELVWHARQAQYHAALHRIVACLQSHRSPLQRCQTLLALHDELVIPHRLRLRTDTYADIFHLFYATAMQGEGRGGRRRPVARSAADAMQHMWREPAAFLTGRSSSGRNGASEGGAMPREMTGRAVVADILLSPAAMAELWRMYRYMIDSGTNPSARIAQYLMGLLEHCAPSALVEARAHSLLLDLDRFHCSPSGYTITSYIGLCDRHGVMHLGLARMTDYQVRQERQASAGMYAALLTGLVRHGHHREAMAAVTTMQSVPISTHLLNAVLQTARHSTSPRSAFTFYRALLCPRRNGPPHCSSNDSNNNNKKMLAGSLVPSVHTFSILCEVMRETGEYTELGFVLREMGRHGVKGNGMLLNKLLQALLHTGQVSQAAMLARTMKAKRIHVFDELEKALRSNTTTSSSDSNGAGGSVVPAASVQA